MWIQQTHTTFSASSLAVYSVLLEYGVHSNRSATHVITRSRKSKLFVASVLTLAVAAPCRAAPAAVLARAHVCSGAGPASLAKPGSRLDVPS